MSDDSIQTSMNDKDGLQHLLDSTYPLLQKFREVCPGTYKHSQSLAAMVEGIAIALGLDVTKMKIAAQYHDIGKMFNSKYFTENQLENEDPHDKLLPTMSYIIITRHVSDSVIILLNDHTFPRDVIEIISQHHGQSVVRYFFSKSGSDIEDSFRYKTTKPKSTEAAVLMICDNIEATTRSMVQAGKSNLSNIVETVINNLIDDGQLDDVVIRLGDLKKIKEALARELEGIYQKRINYEEAKKVSKSIEE